VKAIRSATQASDGGLSNGSDAKSALPVYMTIDDAAARLSTSSTALRARCRRHARREGRDVVARLGAGVIAYKLGASWRVRFPE